MPSSLRSQLMQVAIGLDVGLKEFYTDSNGVMVANPRFLRQSEKRLKLAQRHVSRRVKGSKNRGKARVILGRRHRKKREMFSIAARSPLEMHSTEQGRQIAVIQRSIRL